MTLKNEIRMLPRTAVRSLQSTVVISSLKDCVVELVYNAVDAGCTTVSIRLLDGLDVQVSDNGHGMDPDETKTWIGQVSGTLACCFAMQCQAGAHRSLQRRLKTRMGARLVAAGKPWRVFPIWEHCILRADAITRLGNSLFR
jgi:hypothetical protein